MVSKEKSERSYSSKKKIGFREKNTENDIENWFILNIVHRSEHGGNFLQKHLSPVGQKHAVSFSKMADVADSPSAKMF